MKYIISACLLMVTTFCFGQSNPVKWTFEAQNFDDDHVKVLITAHMDGDWAVYSQFLGDDGPFPTTFVIQDEKGEPKEIEMKEPEGVTEYDPLFEMEIKKFKKVVVFEKVLARKNLSASIKGYVTFMTCDNSRCLPPEDMKFNIAIP